MKTLEPSEITIEGLAESFNAAAIGCEIETDSHELFLSEGLKYPVWLRLDEENKRIKIFTFIDAREGISRDDLFAFAHKLNNEYVTVRYSVMIYEDDDNTYLNGTYFIYTAFGIIVPQLIHTVKNFSDIFIDAVTEQDSDHIFFS